ncbi:CCA tRNA nucleotidyltransferase [Peptoanaerobacter stomatis]
MNTKNFTMQKNAKIIISALKNHSYDAYIVGGYLRDMMLGKRVNDIDIATDALPDEVTKIFKDKYIVAHTGIKYGTVTVVIDNVPIEITTYRSESNYLDGRHPQKINFEKDIKYDLSRRDFTINAMAYNDDRGLIDIFNSKFDLENKIIRCVGNPRKRFKEDKLRMLRAIRFAAQLNFEIEQNTFDAIKSLSHTINDISIERINVELTKMLLTEKPSKAFILMYETGLLKHILPVIDDMYGYDQQNPYHQYDLFFHTMSVLDNIKNDIILRLSALFHDTGKLYTRTIDENGIAHFYGHNKISKEITIKYLKRLKYPNNVLNTVSLLVEKHMIAPDTITPKGIRRLISYIGKENINYLVELQKADSMSTTIGDNDIFEKKVKQVLDEENIFTKKDLALNGNDIKKLGYIGKEIGEILNYLMEIVLDEPRLNTKEILLQKIKDMQ